MTAQPQSRPESSEALARCALEAQRSTPFTDLEWAAVRERLIALARLLRDWEQKEYQKG